MPIAERIVPHVLSRCCRDRGIWSCRESSACPFCARLQHGHHVSRFIKDRLAQELAQLSGAELADDKTMESVLQVRSSHIQSTYTAEIIAMRYLAPSS